jgi:hypothetical protein
MTVGEELQKDGMLGTKLDEEPSECGYGHTKKQNLGRVTA